MAHRVLARAFVAIVVVLAVAGTASAQDKYKGDFGVSYSILTESSDGESTTLPLGFVLSAAGAINDALSIVGEVGWNKKTDKKLVVNVDMSVTSAMGGARVSHGGDPVTMFGQVLVGLARASVGAGAAGIDVRISQNAFAVQPGVGIDYAIKPNLAIRVQGDYRAVFSSCDECTSDESGRANEFRFAFGVAYRFGKR